MTRPSSDQMSTCTFLSCSLRPDSGLLMAKRWRQYINPPSLHRKSLSLNQGSLATSAGALDFAPLCYHNTVQKLEPCVLTHAKRQQSAITSWNMFLPPWHRSTGERQFLTTLLASAGCAQHVMALSSAAAGVFVMLRWPVVLLADRATWKEQPPLLCSFG